MQVISVQTEHKQLIFFCSIKYFFCIYGWAMNFFLENIK